MRAVAHRSWIAILLVAILSGVGGELRGQSAPINTYNRGDLLEAMQEDKPEIISVGNSMQGRGLDFKMLSKRLGVKVFNAENGGAMTIWHYSALKYSIAKLEKKPKMVLIVERENHFTCAPMRARDYAPRSQAMAQGQDWSLVHRLAIQGEGQPAWQKTWDGGGPPLDSFYWDFAKCVNWSFLPFMIQSAKENGYQLVVVRYKSREFAEKPDWYPPEMVKYGDDMAYYLQANGVPFLDYERNPALEKDLYANGDHFSAEGKDIWTDLVATDVKALLAGKVAPNQHLPPKDYQPSADMTAVASNMPELPSVPPMIAAPVSADAVADVANPDETPVATTQPAAAARKARPTTRVASKASNTPAAPTSRPRKGDLTANQESIIYFGDGLRARGITLAVAMIPGPKTSLPWLKDMSSKVQIGSVPLDLSDAFAKVPNRDDLYLSPTTLSPKGVEFVAQALAEQIVSKFPYIGVPLQAYGTKPAEVQVSTTQPALAINQVVVGKSSKSSKFIQPTIQTRLKLVGDRNVGLYSDGTLGMGEHAGLGEHLSKALGRPLQWQWSPKPARAGIVDLLGQINLDQTTVVVWVFPVEELRDGRWGGIRVPEFKEFDQPERLVVKAKIVKKSPPPEPDLNEKYPDTVNYTLWEVQQVIEGEYAGKELLTVEWSQKEMEFLRPFRYEDGQEFTLDLIPLTAQLRKERTIRKADFVDAIQRPDLPPFWIVEHRKK